MADSEEPWTNNSTIANSMYSIDGANNTISVADANRFPRYDNINTQQRAANTISTNVNTYSYGNYYTFAAAVADTTSKSNRDVFSGIIKNSSVDSLGSTMA